MSNNEELRPCEFTLEGHDLMGQVKPGILDYPNEEEYLKATRKRKGKFHKWATEADGQSCGIVEDNADGRIYRINPENICFTDFNVKK